MIWRKAIELNPKDLTYYAELAVVNMRVGRNEAALKALQDALAIDPKYAEAYRLMGIAQLADEEESKKLAKVLPKRKNWVILMLMS